MEHFSRIVRRVGRLEWRFLPPFFACVSALLVSTACERRPSAGHAVPASNIVATVGEATITREALAKELARQGAGRTRESVLEEMIRFECVLAKAKADGYDRRPEIVHDINRLIVARYRENQQAGAEARMGASEEEIRSHYATNVDRYATPERVRAAVIQWHVSAKVTPDKRTEAKARAASVRTAARTLDVAGFAQLVRQHSEDQATRYRGGDAGWLTRSEADTPWEPELLKAIFELATPGDLSGVIETPRGFYVARLLERRPAGVRPIEEVRDRINYELSIEKRKQGEAAFFEQLKAGLSICIYSNVLESVLPVSPAVDRKPPGMPKG